LQETQQGLCVLLTRVPLQTPKIIWQIYTTYTHPGCVSERAHSVCACLCLRARAGGVRGGGCVVWRWWARGGGWRVRAWRWVHSRARVWVYVVPMRKRNDQKPRRVYFVQINMISFVSGQQNVQNIVIVGVVIVVITMLLLQCCY